MSNLNCKVKGTALCKYVDNQSLEICRDCIHLIINKEPIIPYTMHTFDGADFIEIAGERVTLKRNELFSIDKINDLKEQKSREDQIKDPTKAARFNEGKPQWSLVHFKSLEPMVRVLEFGALKYAPKNWQKPMDTMKILESMQRHLVALFDGEEVDSESGISHMGHIMCNAMFYNYHKELKNGPNK